MRILLSILATLFLISLFAFPCVILFAIWADASAIIAKLVLTDITLIISSGLFMVIVKALMEE